MRPMHEMTPGVDRLLVRDQRGTRKSLFQRYLSNAYRAQLTPSARRAFSIIDRFADDGWQDVPSPELQRKPLEWKIEPFLPKAPKGWIYVLVIMGTGASTHRMRKWKFN